MTPRFREDKVTDMTCRLLDLGGGKMNYMKLLKLMYIAFWLHYPDRDASAGRWT